MKIIFYIESLLSGGTERRLVELIKGLNDFPQNELHIVLTNKNIHYDVIKHYVKKIHFTIRKKSKRSVIPSIEFYKIVKKTKPDLIHVWGSLTAFYTLPTSLLTSIPIINNQIAGAPIVKLSLFNNFLNFLNFKFSVLVIANSYAGLKAYNAPLKKSLVIHNGFNFSRLENLKTIKSVKREFRINTELVVGMVANFSIYKDYKTYINTAIRVLEKRNDVTFISIGSGSYTDYVKEIPDQFNDRILFLGKQKNVEEIMRCCDIGVLTSYTEGISNSLLEFMALGKPVITTAKGGTPELIEDQGNGFLFEIGDFLGISNMIIKLLNDVKLRMTIGESAKNTILYKFEMSKMVSSYYNVYQDILNLDCNP